MSFCFSFAAAGFFSGGQTFPFKSFHKHKRDITILGTSEVIISKISVKGSDHLQDF